MKKLLKLREWLTVEEAARHLTSVLEEEVGVADVLRLSLDGHLTLSVNLVNKAEAKIGRIVPFKDVPMLDLPPLRTGGSEIPELRQVPDGILIEQGERLTDETPFLCFDKGVVTIDGVWDLAMIGGERHDVEHAFQSLTGGPAVELISLDGSFVLQPSGQWAALQDQLPDREEVTPNGKRKKVRGDYYPANGLPPNAPLVIRTAVLTEFQMRMLSPPPTEPTRSGSMGTRERDTLLKLVVGMAIGGYGYAPDAARSKTAGEIVADLAKRGISISDDTVRAYLKEAAATVLPLKS